MTPEELAELMKGVTGAVQTAIKPVSDRLEALEKMIAKGGKLVKIGNEYKLVDPEKLIASTQNPQGLPKLTVVQPDTTKPAGTPGGQLTEPWPDPNTARPPTQR